MVVLRGVGGVGVDGVGFGNGGGGCGVGGCGGGEGVVVLAVMVVVGRVFVVVVVAEAGAGAAGGGGGQQKQRGSLQKFLAHAFCVLQSGNIGALVETSKNHPAMVGSSNQGPITLSRHLRFKGRLGIHNS